MSQFCDPAVLRTMPVVAACLVVPFCLPHYMRILTVSRKTDPDAIGLPGGKVDPDETPLDAAIRETYEETRLVVSRRRAVLLCDDLDESDVRVVTYVVMGGVAWSSTASAPPMEAGVVRWSKPVDVANRGPFQRYNREVLRRMRDLGYPHLDGIV